MGSSDSQPPMRWYARGWRWLKFAAIGPPLAVLTLAISVIGAAAAADAIWLVVVIGCAFGAAHYVLLDPELDTDIRWSRSQLAVEIGMHTLFMSAAWWLAWEGLRWLLSLR